MTAFAERYGDLMNDLSGNMVFRRRLYLVALLATLGFSMVAMYGIYHEHIQSNRERIAASNYRDLVEEFVIVTMDVPQLILDQEGKIEYANLAAGRHGFADAASIPLFDRFKMTNAALVADLIRYPDESRSVRTAFTCTRGMTGTMRIQPRLTENGWRFWVIMQFHEPASKDGANA